MLVCAILSGGCGGGADSGAGGAADNTPRRGEHDMKKQMEILQQKGTLSRVPGVPKDLINKKP